MSGEVGALKRQLDGLSAKMDHNIGFLKDKMELLLERSADN